MDLDFLTEEVKKLAIWLWTVRTLQPMQLA